MFYDRLVHRFQKMTISSDLTFSPEHESLVGITAEEIEPMCSNRDRSCFPFYRRSVLRLRFQFELNLLVRHLKTRLPGVDYSTAIGSCYCRKFDL